MTLLPRWMRIALAATAVMNLFGALSFTPLGAPVRALAGLPETAHPVYLLIIAVFVLIFGVAYGWTAVVGRADPLFIAIAAAGKLSLFALLTAFWAFGDLSWRAPLAGTGDLFFGVLFVKWLLAAR